MHVYICLKVYIQNVLRQYRVHNSVKQSCSTERPHCKHTTKTKEFPSKQDKVLTIQCGTNVSICLQLLGFSMPIFL